MKTKIKRTIIPCLLAAFLALSAILICASAAAAAAEHTMIIGREIELKHGQIGIHRNGADEWFSPADVPVQGVERTCEEGETVHVTFTADEGYVVKGKYIYAYGDDIEDGRAKLNSHWVASSNEGDITVPSDLGAYTLTIDASFKPADGKREISVGSRSALSNGKVRIENDTGTLFKEFTQHGDCLADEGANYKVSFIGVEGYKLDEKKVLIYSFDDDSETEIDPDYEAKMIAIPLRCQMTGRMNTRS